MRAANKKITSIILSCIYHQTLNSPSLNCSLKHETQQLHIIHAHTITMGYRVYTQA